jgi:hypothetical protein
MSHLGEAGKPGFLRGGRLVKITLLTDDGEYLFEVDGEAVKSVRGVSTYF